MTLITIMLLMVLATCLVYIIRYLKYRERVVRRLSRIPGIKTYPVIGNCLDFFVPHNCLLQTYVKIFEKCGPLLVIWAGTIPIVFLGSHEYAQVVLGSAQCIEKGNFYSFFEPWLGTGVLTASGQKWQMNRKLLTPTFHFKILENFLEVFTEKSEILVRMLQREIGSHSFDIYPYINRCTLDIICETAMGTELNSQTEDVESEYVKAVHSTTELVMERVLHPWLYPDFIYQKTKSGKRFKEDVRIMHDFNLSVIRSRRQSFRNSQSPEKRTDVHDIGRKKQKIFLDLLLESSENGVRLNDKEILDEVETFMVAGHDTVTSAISWTIQMLGTNPDVQEKVCEELENIFQGSNRPPTVTDLAEMKYLERVIKETLRLNPAAPVILRKLTEDTEIGGHTIPAGVNILIPIFYIHRSKEQFPNPMKFDPDNFLPERVVKRHPYSYIPFSAGPRNCIGQKFALLEEKTILSYILRHYRVRAVHKNVPAVPCIVLKPENGILVNFEPRNRNTSV